VGFYPQYFTMFSESSGRTTQILRRKFSVASKQINNLQKGTPPIRRALAWKNWEAARGLSLRVPWRPVEDSRRFKSGAGIPSFRRGRALRRAA
jgi:hypothetical protein